MRRSAPLQILPSPWSPDLGAGAALNSVLGGGSANAALYVPCFFPVSTTITAVQWRPQNATGNYDLGLYDEDLNRIASKGSTAMSDAVHSLSVVCRVKAGSLVWVGFALSSTSGRFSGQQFNSATSLYSLGMVEQASALPLPDPATPAIVSSWLHVPFFSFTVQ